MTATPRLVNNQNQVLPSRTKLVVFCWSCEHEVTPAAAWMARLYICWTDDQGQDYRLCRLLTFSCSDILIQSGTAIDSYQQLYNEKIFGHFVLAIFGHNHRVKLFRYSVKCYKIDKMDYHKICTKIKTWNLVQSQLFLSISLWHYHQVKASSWAWSCLTLSQLSDYHLFRYVVA